MKIKKSVSLLIIFFTVISCNYNNKRNSEAINSNTAIGHDSPFDAFFKKFTEDSDFQISRIIFPLEQRYYDENTDTLISQYLEKENWKFVELDKPSGDTINNDSTDKYVVSVSGDNMKIVYSIKGVDNGINIYYYFKYDNDKWFLYKTIDESY